jgi:hypothetical protein
MSGLDDLLSRSRSPGTFVERREFTLSRDKAVEKLREFSLRHPAGYVLELVQAAVFAGATYIAIDIRDGELLVAWVGGRSCGASQLDHIFDYLFASRSDPETRHLTQLAIGLNALLQRKPKLVRMESGDGTPEGTVRVDLDRKGDGTLGRPELAMAGTYLLVRFRTGWFERFDGEDFYDEEALVESRCVYSPVPILLNGRAPFGYRPNTTLRMFGTEDEESFSEGGRRGVLAIPGALERQARHRSAIGFRVVVGGVWITTIDLPALGRAAGDTPLVGVLCDDGLRKTADQSDIVQDQAFVRLLHAAAPHATALLQRNKGGGWAPPELPPLLEIEREDGAAPSGPVAEPLPARIPQLGPREDLAPDALAALPSGTRVFWVRPDDAPSLGGPTDPGRFPFPVLLLGPGQARSLAHMAPGLALSALASPADVDFVHNALLRQGALHLLEAELEHRGERHRLQLRLDMAGCPDPTRGGPGSIPFCMGEGGRSTWCGALDLGLPGVSLHLEHHAPEPDYELEQAVAEVAVAAAWAWVLPGPQLVQGDSPLLRDLRCALLAETTKPLFVERGAELVLDPVLLGVPDEARDAALDMVLAETHAGPLCLRELMALQGSRRVVALRDPVDRRRLLPLEDLLGWGHIVADDDDRFPLCAMGSFAGGWRSLGRRDLRWKGYGHVLYIPQAFRVPPVFADWAPHDTGLPLVGAVSAPGAPAAVDWDEGMRLLRRELERAHRVDGWSDLAGDSTPIGQRKAMGRLGRCILSAISGQGDPQGSAEPAAAVIPRGGAIPHGHEVIQRSFDELSAVAGISGVRPRLHLDDAPADYGWGQPEPDQRWVIRHTIRGAGLRGSIGLRVPFDPSAAVLLHSCRSLHVLYGGEQCVPVHGVIRLSPGQTEPGEEQEELLLLERILLYQDLVSVLDQPDLAEERLEAARHYAAAFAVDAWRRGHLHRGGARELAARVPAPPYASLLAWLDSEPEGAPPERLHPATLRFYRAGPVVRAAGSGVDLEGRFQRAIGTDTDITVSVVLQYLSGEAERVRIIGEREGNPVFLLNLRNSTVTRVVDAGAYGSSFDKHRLSDELGRRLHRDRDLLLLDMAWRFARWARDKDLPVDLPAIHRALLAASLDA